MGGFKIVFNFKDLTYDKLYYGVNVNDKNNILINQHPQKLLIRKTLSFYTGNSQ